MFYFRVSFVHSQPPFKYYFTFAAIGCHLNYSVRPRVRVAILNIKCTLGFGWPILNISVRPRVQVTILNIQCVLGLGRSF